MHAPGSGHEGGGRAALMVSSIWTQPKARVGVVVEIALGVSSLVWFVSFSNFVLFVLSKHKQKFEVEGSKFGVEFCS